jgi:hypothetical protein
MFQRCAINLWLSQLIASDERSLSWALRGIFYSFYQLVLDRNPSLFAHSAKPFATGYKTQRSPRSSLFRSLALSLLALHFPLSIDSHGHHFFPVQFATFQSNTKRREAISHFAMTTALRQPGPQAVTKKTTNTISKKNLSLVASGTYIQSSVNFPNF